MRLQHPDTQKPKPGQLKRQRRREAIHAARAQIPQRDEAVVYKPLG